MGLAVLTLRSRTESRRGWASDPSWYASNPNPDEATPRTNRMVPTFDHCRRTMEVRTPRASETGVPRKEGCEPLQTESPP